MAEEMIPLLETIARTVLLDITGSLASTPFRSPALSKTMTTPRLRAESSDEGLARDLFGGDGARRGESGVGLPSFPRSSFALRLRSMCLAGEPRLLTVTYAAVVAALRAATDCGKVAKSDSPPQGIDFETLLIELDGVFSGFSSRMLRDLNGVASSIPEAIAARSPATDAEDEDLRRLVTSAITASVHSVSGRLDPSAPAQLPPATLSLPHDISLRFTPELESKLHARSPADLLAFRAREQLRDRTFAVFRAYRDIGSSLQAQSWPEFAAGLPAQVMTLRPLILACNAAWFARLLIAELELFHSYELLGGPMLTGIAGAGATAGRSSDIASANRIHQLAERLDGTAWTAPPTTTASMALECTFVGSSASSDPVFRSAVAAGGSTRESVASMAAGVELRPVASDKERMLIERMAGTANVAGGGRTPIGSVQSDQQRAARSRVASGAWQHGPPLHASHTRLPVLASQGSPSPSPVSVDEVAAAGAAGPKASRKMDERLPGGQAGSRRRVVPDDGGVRGMLGQEVWGAPQRTAQPFSGASARHGVGRTPQSGSSAAGGLGPGAEEQALSAALLIADTLKLQGSVRLITLLVVLLDSSSVSAALRLAAASALTRTADGPHVISDLSDKCERSLLLHVHRSRALAQVVAALDYSALLASTQSAFHSDLQVTCKDLLLASPSVDCSSVLQRAAQSQCLSAVVPWVCSYVSCALRCVPLSVHVGLQTVVRLLLGIASEAQSSLLSARVSSSADASPAEGETAQSLLGRTCRVTSGAALALFACVEELCHHPAVLGGLPLSESPVLQQQPQAWEAGGSGLQCVDLQPDLIGHRFLVECSARLRALHEQARKAATLWRRSGDTIRARCSGSGHDSVSGNAVQGYGFKTPSKNRTSAGAALVPSDASPLAPIASPEQSTGTVQSTNTEDACVSTQDAPSGPVTTPHRLNLGEDHSRLLPQSPAPVTSSRKIRPVLLHATAASKGEGGNNTSLPSPVPATTRAQQLALLTGPSFQSSLISSYFSCFPHLQRLCGSLAEAAAVEALYLSSPQLASSGRVTDIFAVVQQATIRVKQAVAALFDPGDNHCKDASLGSCTTSSPQFVDAGTASVSLEAAEGSTSVNAVHVRILEKLCVEAAEARIQAHASRLATAGGEHS
jgi:hypothetical protein